MNDIVEQIKQQVKIQDVIGETFPLQREHGRYLRCREHDSLVVDVRKQTYTWNSKGERSGDVIQWVMVRNGWDFKSAVEHLCRRANLPEPRWSKEDQAARAMTRQREEAFQVALGVFQRWLWADAEALAYARGRGWTDETIQEAELGFSGRATAAEYQEMRGELGMHSVDVEHPNAAAILGWRGNVVEWGKRWGVEVQDNWVSWGMIPGMMGKTRLVYPHILFGRVRSFSGRNILGAEMNSEGREVKAFNLPVPLAGGRQAFFNHAYTPGAEACVVVEGQADAVTLGQWDVAAAALAGTAWQDHTELLGELRKRHKALYVGLDGDEAGLKALIGREGEWPLAKLLGPGCRVMRWAANA